MFYVFVWFASFFAAVLPWVFLYFLYDEASNWWCRDSFIGYCTSNRVGKFLFVMACISTLISVMTVVFH